MLEHDVFHFSSAGKQAVDAHTKCEMRRYEEEYGRPTDAEDRDDHLWASSANAEDNAKLILEDLCHVSDHEILGAHLLDLWKDELLEYGVSCGYSNLRVKELRALYVLRQIPTEFLKKDLVK